MDRQTHWNDVYATKAERGVSWFEALPSVSLEMLDAAGLNETSCVLDVGGGESRLVDALVGRGLDCVAVLDVSATALEHARTRLGTAAETVTWLAADVASEWSLKAMDIWHDRAVFHFLTEPADRARYVAQMRDVLKAGGTAIVATFAPDGPEKCSGLRVARYSPETLAAELGAPFNLAESRRHLHQTPWGTTQAFQYSRFVKGA